MRERAIIRPSPADGAAVSSVMLKCRVGSSRAPARRRFLVPFMTMASLSGSAPAYMFATRSMETLSAILSAVSR